MNEWWIKNVRQELEIEENRIIRNIFGPETPNINELKKNVDMLFLNIHPIFVDNQPVPPDVIYVGGIHIKPRKELPKDLSKVLDSSKSGVIYFSMGTNIKKSHLPSETIQMFINTFSSLPYDILWKCDEDIQITSKNIKILKWFPQSDLLAHPKVKLFITQGGLQSTDEAINAGVPLIGLPMIADQWYNVEKYVHHKIGLKLDISTLTKEGLINAIETVITNNSYRQNILRLRALMQDQKEKPLERAVRWIEYTLRHGGTKHMRSGAGNLTWQQYYELELIIIAVAIILISMGLFLDSQLEVNWQLE
ncbi:UDP-glycosyltransferase UGT33B1 [Danaus plexippus plexippus]|uniref:UDP-glucuronosyltransferase n=1 Tax=Danaus plexippus plexippus TaxID=278856 RepID=A0A212FKM1_DANPL|nr:UDP-glycosyltransferase UGT33B1 [Danaus plexippus plexippus]